MNYDSVGEKLFWLRNYKLILQDQVEEKSSLSVNQSDQLGWFSVVGDFSKEIQYMMRRNGVAEFSDLFRNEPAWF